MKITFSIIAWEDYLSWQKESKKILRKINDLIKDIQKTPFEGLGKPEPLKYDLTGNWSRRIDREHRLVYKFQKNELLIYACMFHYD
ncbi:MAG: Txe/YoeB family addiction module toxin [Melioribacteraceae bacterium]|nr:Txe/YoeB family addiction module toxin [Melioribacteraceae bacterium]MCF8354085.1 Txe/YoeB family addiction module toxin [Melioribacteraceae bacterium]MCF8393757.1 Txe/YoeB family addiction module toxin [Melioribacteraceae bacterium]MCF8419501.1 Txe/YoeB family addiction module toxin [Melioribacteraceae bacterium]